MIEQNVYDTKLDVTIDKKSYTLNVMYRFIDGYTATLECPECPGVAEYIVYKMEGELPYETCIEDVDAYLNSYEGIEHLTEQHILTRTIMEDEQYV